MLHKLSVAAEKIGVHKQTAWNYVKAGKLKAEHRPNGRIYVSDEEISRFNGENSFVKDKGVAIYARVSSSENKTNLDAQADRLVQYANARGWRVARIEKEIASGVNDTRPKLLSLLREHDKYDQIIVEHRDRLTRFGFHLITNNINNIHVVNEVDNMDHGLMEDLVSIITSFCARIYGQRRSHRKTEKIIAELSHDND